MKAGALLLELIENFSEFENYCEEKKMELKTSDFVEFMSTKFNQQSVKRESISGEIEDWKPVNFEEYKSLTDISILVVLMFRYAKTYIRKALKDSEIKTADEFSFLITLLSYESMTKMELINQQILEKTSGMEIINRLIKSGYIEQQKDENDKRSVRISITQKGREEVLKTLPQMQMVSKIVVGNLEENEISTLVQLLSKLDYYHNDIFHNKKDFELSELIN